jgi:hypothetical protein
MKDRYRLYRSTKFILLATIMALFFCGCSFAQKKQVKSTTTKSLYKLYTDQQYHFQFDIPAQFKMTSSGDGENYNLEAITKVDKKIFADYNGIVFSLRVKKQPLEVSIENDFEKGPDGAYYIKGTGFDSLSKATVITGNGFKGLKRVISCRVNPGKDDSMMMDGCEVVYLSNGILTLLFETDGIAIEDQDLEQITKSLNFFD